MNLMPRRSLFDFDDFRDFWAPLRQADSPEGTLFPRVDVRDKDDHFEITAELPGVHKDDLHVTLHDGILTIEAETKQEDKEEKDGRIIRQERRYGKFARSFSVGDSVSEADIAAEFKDGILKLSAPKAKPKAPEARRIEVR
jgi:HSP20 family protein